MRPLRFATTAAPMFLVEPVAIPPARSRRRECAVAAPEEASQRPLQLPARVDDHSPGLSPPARLVSYRSEGNVSPESHASPWRECLRVRFLPARPDSSPLAATIDVTLPWAMSVAPSA